MNIYVGPLELRTVRGIRDQWARVVSDMTDNILELEEFGKKAGLADYWYEIGKLAPSHKTRHPYYWIRGVVFDQVKLAGAIPIDNARMVEILTTPHIAQKEEHGD